MELNLKDKPDAILINDLKTMVSEERKLLIQILHYLKEVESRRLHLAGKGLFFSFCLCDRGIRL